MCSALPSPLTWSREDGYCYAGAVTIRISFAADKEQVSVGRGRQEVLFRPGRGKQRDFGLNQIIT